MPLSQVIFFFAWSKRKFSANRLTDSYHNISYHIMISKSGPDSSFITHYYLLQQFRPPECMLTLTKHNASDFLEEHQSRFIVFLLYKVHIKDSIKSHLQKDVLQLLTTVGKHTHYWFQKRRNVTITEKHCHNEDIASFSWYQDALVCTRHLISISRRIQVRRSFHRSPA